VITAVDSAILIDIFQDEPGHAAASADALDEAQTAGPVVACEVVWAEVSGRFGDPRDAAGALGLLGIDFVAIGEDAALDAGRLWKAFRASGGSRRERVVADFLVGSHALHHAERLLTRDRGFYRRYFSKLKVVEPG
jgi:hypothetical protein